MARTYAREESRWDFDILQLMVADGVATFYPGGGGGIYVIKTEDGPSIAVRPHQVIHPAEKAEIFRAIAPTVVVAEVTPTVSGTERTDGEDAVPAPETRSRAWVSRDEEKELLSYFGI